MTGRVSKTLTCVARCRKSPDARVLKTKKTEDNIELDNLARMDIMMDILHGHVKLRQRTIIQIAVAMTYMDELVIFSMKRSADIEFDGLFNLYVKKFDSNSMPD